MKNDVHNSKRLRIRGKEVYFNHDVNFVLEVEDYFIVLLTNRDSENIHDQPDNNIYAVDKEANILWNIKDIVGNNPYFGSFYFLPSHEVKDYLVAVDCLGYHHTIDLKSKQVISVKRMRLDASEGKSCIGIVQAEEVDGYQIVYVQNFCTNNVGRQLKNNIYAVDKDFNIIWNIKEIVGDNGFGYGSFKFIPSPTRIPYLETSDGCGCYHTIDLTLRKVMKKECYPFGK
jgi:hypothetical protein